MWKTHSSTNSHWPPSSQAISFPTYGVAGSAGVSFALGPALPFFAEPPPSEDFLFGMMTGAQIGRKPEVEKKMPPEPHESNNEFCLAPRLRKKTNYICWTVVGFSHFHSMVCSSHVRTALWNIRHGICKTLLQVCQFTCRLLLASC